VSGLLFAPSYKRLTCNVWAARASASAARRHPVMHFKLMCIICILLYARERGPFYIRDAAEEQVKLFLAAEWEFDNKVVQPRAAFMFYKTRQRATPTLSLSPVF
jgi:hypothetical protein